MHNLFSGSNTCNEPHISALLNTMLVLHTAMHFCVTDMIIPCNRDASHFRFLATEQLPHEPNFPPASTLLPLLEKIPMIPNPT